MPSAICRMLLLQMVFWLCAFAFAKAGKSSAARIATMAMTTSNSINVKARRQAYLKTRSIVAAEVTGRTCLTIFERICFLTPATTVFEHPIGSVVIFRVGTWSSHCACADELLVSNNHAAIGLAHRLIGSD